MNRLTVYIDGEAREDHSRDERKRNGFKNGSRACMARLAAYEDTGLEPHEIQNLHERLNAEDAKVGKWAVCIGDTFHGVAIVGADYEHKTVTLDWSENGGADE